MTSTRGGSLSGVWGQEYSLMLALGIFTLLNLPNFSLLVGFLDLLGLLVLLGLLALLGLLILAGLLPCLAC